MNPEMPRDDEQLPRRWPAVAAALALCASTALLVAACGDEPDPEEDPDDNGRQIIDPPDREPKWSSQIVASDASSPLDLAAGPDGAVGAVYFSDAPTPGEACDEFGVDPAPTRQNWGIYYAWRDGASWSSEQAYEAAYVGPPKGVAVDFDGSGTPHIATMIGPPVESIRYCGVNDVGLLTRAGAGDWAEETAVATSGEAASGMPASDFGDVVGFWPALTFDEQGQPVIAYKDVHSGSIMSDDTRRADLELAWRRGGWDAIPVDMGLGAGDHNELAFDSQGRLHLAYYVPTESQQMSRRGVWMRRLVEPDTWEQVHLYNQPSPGGHALAMDPETGGPVALFYQSDKGYPELATLTDEAAFESVSEGWELEDIGNSRYDEGYSGSIAYSKSGRMAVAYYRCTEATKTLGDCLPEDDALIFKWRDAGEWIEEVVDDGDAQGLCGRDPAMVIDADGRPVIAYRCEVVEDGQLTNVIKIARRKVLP